MNVDDIKLEEMSEAGAELHLRHPVTFEPLSDENGPVLIKLVGRDSARYRNAFYEISKENAVNNPRRSLTVDESENSASMLAAKCTIGWTNLSIDGAEDFSVQNAFELYSRRRWVRDQVEEFIRMRENFLKVATPS